MQSQLIITIVILQVYRAHAVYDHDTLPAKQDLHNVTASALVRNWVTQRHPLAFRVAILNCQFIPQESHLVTIGPDILTH